MISSRNNLRNGRIPLPPQGAASKEVPRGIHHLGLHKERDALLYVPQTYVSHKPAPFALLLHGAGGSAEHGLFLLRELAERHNIILLAPSSRSSTWDVISDGVFDVDVLLIKQAMEMVFQTYAIDSSRFAIGGFSDGASYALSLGLVNGDLFTHILAFSPGFYHAQAVTGKPKLFISHGVNDNVLPLRSCSRRIVPKLQREGYDVTYLEFGDGHVVPGDIRSTSVNWFLC